MRRTIVVVACLAAAAAGCSSGKDGTGSSPASGANLTAVQLAQRAGCSATGPTGDEETTLFIQDQTACADPAWATDADKVAFYVFGNNEGRDAWLKLSATFGDKGVLKGDRWAVEIPDSLPNLDGVAGQINDKLGGERVS
jgi:hypothetical protein